MKKLYTLAALLMLSFSTSFAQSSDLQILHSIQDGDTIKIQSTNPPQYALGYGFVNHGPDTLKATDTIFLSTPYAGALYLTLVNSGGLQVGDTLYASDTVGFNQGPATGPGQWCDSIWAKGATGVIPDNDLTNNKLCNSIYILNLTTSISDKFGTGKAAATAKLNVYPNPAVNAISFDYNVLELGEAIVVITDITGRKVYQEEKRNVYGVQKMNIDVSNFNNGIYILELRVDGVKHVGKFTVQK